VELTATPSLKPQTKRVARKLMAAGERGVHSFEFRTDPDGYIADPAKRVSELKNDFNCDIASSDKVRFRGGATGVTYTWRGAPPEVLDLIKGRTPGSSAAAGGTGITGPAVADEPGAPHTPGVRHDSSPVEPAGGDPSESSSAGTLFGDQVGAEAPRHPLLDSEAA